MSVCDGDVTVTVATALLLITVSCAEPLLPSLVAVTVSAPGASAVTIPVLLTLATLVGVADQVVVRPVSTLPEASRSVAVNCSVWVSVIDCASGETLTDETGDVTGGVGPPSLPPQEASAARAAMAKRSLRPEDMSARSGK